MRVFCFPNITHYQKKKSCGPVIVCNPGLELAAEIVTCGQIYRFQSLDQLKVLGFHARRLKPRFSGCYCSYVQITTCAARWSVWAAVQASAKAVHSCHRHGRRTSPPHECLAHLVSLKIVCEMHFAK